VIVHTDDLSDLPPAVLAQLGKVKKDDLEKRIVRLFDEGPLNIDQVLIALYRKHKLALTRKFLTAKLYRMATQGKLAPVLGRKGVYLNPRSKK
jgi:hypothetical protein